MKINLFVTQNKLYCESQSMKYILHAMIFYKRGGLNLQEGQDEFAYT